MGNIINLDDYRSSRPVYGPEPMYDTVVIELFPKECA